MQYSVLSRFYDLLMTDFDYDGYEKFILGRISGARGLDLACGSGEMTVRLLKAGFSVTGVDISPEMLGQAAAKAKAAYKDVLLLEADLNALSLKKRYDFAVSVCDGFNYVKSEKALKAAFSAVYNALNEGGRFIFDMSTAYKLKKIVGNNLFYEDDENLTYFWSNELKKNSVNMSLTFFEKKGTAYQRYDEFQTQYFYENDVIIGLLTSAGFKCEAFSGTFSRLTDDSERIVICATK